jgi:hypothetical protein
MKNLKIKAMAYTINSFVLGLTGGWIIPAEFYKPVSIVTAIILLLMFLTDLKGAFPKDKPKRKANMLKAKKERPPRRRKRKKRK